MTCGLVHASYSLPEWQAVKLTFFAPYMLADFPPGFRLLTTSRSTTNFRLSSMSVYTQIVQCALETEKLGQKASTKFQEIISAE